MEVLSSLRISKTLLAIFSIVLLSYFPADGQGTSMVHLPNASQLVKRSSFPSGFLFGASSSALQIEGSAGGKGPGVWDDIVQRDKGVRIKDTDKFPTMIQHYQRYKEDVQHLKKLGINTYKFSISWSRLLPDGTLKGGVNQEGVDFYNNLINELLANDITPFATILHFDHPQALQQKFGGFLNRSIVNYYKAYAELVFKTYGDRVKHWATINEPEITGIYNYMHGYDNIHAEPCQTTKACRGAYIVVHNYLLAHAATVQLYREKFQATQGGEIGLVLSVENYVPYSSKPEDVAAAERLTDFFAGWVVEPVAYGDYPKSMRKLVGDRLPNFTEEETNMVKGSIDFIGINYYLSHFARNEPNKTNINNLNNYDSLATKETLNAEGKLLGYLDETSGRYVFPEGLYNILLNFKNKYQNPKIYITENGISSGRNLTNPLKDKHRINFIARHLNYTKAAIDNGVNVRGYFVWAAFDTFEFYEGFTAKMGLIYIDFANNLKRIPKSSAKWYRKFLTGQK